MFQISRMKPPTLVSETRQLDVLGLSAFDITICFFRTGYRNKTVNSVMLPIVNKNAIYFLKDQFLLLRWFPSVLFGFKCNLYKVKLLAGIILN